MSGFVHLHLHSHYSALDGLGKVPDIVARAVEIGAPAVAITDHASISSMSELFKEAKDAGIKPIIGCEFYVVDKVEGEKGEKRYHLTVLAKSWKGVQSMMRQLSVANRQFYRRPRLTFPQALEFEDCIVMSACGFGLMAHEAYEKITPIFKARYGEDFFLELMPLSIEHQRETNRRAIVMSTRHEIPVVATMDAHYVRQEDAQTHAVLISIQFGQKWDDPDRKDFGDEIYMRSEEEMEAAFRITSPEVAGPFLEEAIRVSPHVIADRCNVEIPDFPVELPSPNPEGDDFEQFSQGLLDGVKTKLKGLDTEQLMAYMDRLKYEIGVIKSQGYVRYFLIVKDIIDWSRSQGIMVGPARGSSCGSLACYLMDITQVDPLRHGLYFERFLNPSRVSMPDIDVDFADDRRHEVFAYIKNKYGVEFTSNINTFGKMTVKSAFRDVARVFGVSPLTVGLLGKYVEEPESFEEVPELVKFGKENPEVVKFSAALDGIIRQHGVHACGIVVSSRKLDEVCVQERRKDDVMVCNWDMRDCERFGLLKVDVLGLSTLTILNTTAQLIEKNHGVTIDWTKVPLDDPAVMEAFSKGEGIGVFQFENHGMQRLLKDLQAKDFETIMACTALYRPGSLESGETAKYVRIVNGDEYEEYPCPQAREVLKETKGILVYQEQIMRLVSEVAGRSLAEADTFRKIIGKKLGKDKLEEHRVDFVEGCGKHSGLTASVANDIFDKMVSFAKYSFNKSHACAYTYLSVWAMWAKVHYPLEFLCAALTSAKDERKAVLVKEAERLGVEVRMPDINLSGREFITVPEENALIAPLACIKGVGEKALDTIMENRATSPYLSVEDLKERVYRRTCNSKVVQCLIDAGAFESLGVGVTDPILAEKRKNELLTIYTSVPSLTLESSQAISKAEHLEFQKRVLEYGAVIGENTLLPKFWKLSPPIMVVNNAQTNECEHLTADGTKFLFNALKERGIPSRAVYYTSPVKYVYGKDRGTGKRRSAPREVEAKCLEFLRDEIKMLRPKLILCTASQLIPFFSGEKSGIGKVNGKIIYCKEFDAYVVFSYSSQYAFYNDDVMPAFEKSMDVLGEIFGSHEPGPSEEEADAA